MKFQLKSCKQAEHWDLPGQLGVLRCVVWQVSFMQGYKRARWELPTHPQLQRWASVLLLPLSSCGTEGSELNLLLLLLLCVVPPCPRLVLKRHGEPLTAVTRRKTRQVFHQCVDTHTHAHTEAELFLGSFVSVAHG